jgi:hypothetical protein
MRSSGKRIGHHGRIRKITRDHLDQLTAEDLKQLAEFANRRLGSLPRSGFTAEDAVQKALFSIVLGTARADAGRQPKIEHLRTKSAFLHYLRSAINSVIEGLGRSREFLYFHQSIHEMQDPEERRTTAPLASPVEPDGDSAMVDLKTELFKRLRQNASRELLPVIDEWESTFFWASHVPCRRKRDHVRRVRILAMRTLRELAEDLRP